MRSSVKKLSAPPNIIWNYTINSATNRKGMTGSGKISSYVITCLLHPASLQGHQTHSRTLLTSPDQCVLLKTLYRPSPVPSRGSWAPTMAWAVTSSHHLSHPPPDQAKAFAWECYLPGVNSGDSDTELPITLSHTLVLGVSLGLLKQGLKVTVNAYCSHSFSELQWLTC